MKNKKKKLIVKAVILATAILWIPFSFGVIFNFLVGDIIGGFTPIMSIGLGIILFFSIAQDIGDELGKTLTKIAEITAE